MSEYIGTLEVEIEYARAYANPGAEDRAETLLRQYAAAHGVPDRETTVRLARDASEASCPEYVASATVYGASGPHEVACIYTEEAPGVYRERGWTFNNIPVDPADLPDYWVHEVHARLPDEEHGNRWVTQPSTTRPRGVRA